MLYLENKRQRSRENKGVCMKEEIIKSDSAQIQAKRNYSFLAKDKEALDVVESGDASFVVPAQPGSCYWAIIRIGYENHDQPIRKDDFIDAIAALMEDRDPERWSRFVNKKKIKTFKKQEVVEKDANDWRSRVETNIKTMCRHSGSNPYGQRLIERGHILRYEPDAFDGAGGYCLRTTTNEPVQRRKKAKVADEKENAVVESNIVK